MRSFFAPGKIMLTGEYLVMNGFDCIALPTKLGQWMHVWEFETPTGSSDFIMYQAKDVNGNVWFETKILLPNFEIVDPAQIENIQVDRIVGILKLADSEFWQAGKSIRIETVLEFERTTGLGSSSTLVKLFSDYLNVDPFKIQFEIFGGSGYDVAVAKFQKPLIYWLTEDDSHWKYWKLNSELSHNWYVVFYGQKMDSRASVSGVQEALNHIAEDGFYTAQFDKILEMSKNATDMISLESSLEMYQMLLAQALLIPTTYDLLGIKPSSLATSSKKVLSE
jgi:mevalonate kinase